MALIWANTYTDTEAPTSAYPYGSSKNADTGLLNGTPLEKAAYDDIIGLMAGLLMSGGVVPNGNSDSATNPQYVEALVNHRYYDKINYRTGTRVIGSDAREYVCKQNNGPASTTVDPVTEAAPREYWQLAVADAFDLQHPVGSWWFSDVNQSPADLFGVGTWTRVLGRFPIGVNEADPDFNVAGKVGGSKTHNHAASSSSSSAGSHAHGVAIDGYGSTQSGGALPEPTTFGRLVTGSGQLEANENLESLGHANTSPFTDTRGAHTHTISTNVASASSLGPYQAAYIWRRTA